LWDLLLAVVLRRAEFAGVSALAGQTFTDRREAGKLLAAEMAKYAGRDDVVVLGLPRGGVPVAWEVARGLRAPLDVLIVRKLGAPGQPELAIGAIGEGGVRVLNEGLIRGLMIPARDIDRIAAVEEEELQRRISTYRGSHEPLVLKDKTVIVVDDGVATGATMRVGLQAVKAMGAARVIAAFPVGAPDSVAGLAEDADEVVVLETPAWFGAVGEWYEDFRPTTDEDVQRILAGSRQGPG
jgi:predicted phosphoribosyltransferase